MISDMLEYYKMVSRLNINIIYSGPVWADSIESLAATLKKRMELDELPLSASQSVFSVFVEQMNNILMYSAEKEAVPPSDDKQTDVSKGIFMMGAKGRKYFIQSGNLIKAESASLIKGRLDYLNTLDKTQLRKYYKEQIRGENSNPESKGGGIGFIEIARRASSKIEYAFEAYGDGLVFFTMFVTIG